MMFFEMVVPAVWKINFTLLVSRKLLIWHIEDSSFVPTQYRVKYLLLCWCLIREPGQQCLFDGRALGWFAVFVGASDGFRISGRGVPTNSRYRRLVRMYLQLNVFVGPGEKVWLPRNTNSVDAKFLFIDDVIFRDTFMQSIWKRADDELWKWKEGEEIDWSFSWCSFKAESVDKNGRHKSNLNLNVQIELQNQHTDAFKNSKRAHCLVYCKIASCKLGSWIHTQG